MRRATLRTGSKEVVVAVKELRVADDTNLDDLKRVGSFPTSGSATSEVVIQRFLREILVLNKLNHPNIVPFLGHHLTADPITACIVFPWMEKGDLMRYTKTCCPDVLEKLRMVRRAELRRG